MKIKLIPSKTWIQDCEACTVHHVTCQNSKELFNELRFWKKPERKGNHREFLFLNKF